MVKTPPDYFIAKFNYLVGKSNSIKGLIRNGKFNGYIGPDFFPMNSAVQLIFKLDFNVAEKDGGTERQITTALNPTFVGIGLFTLMMLVIGALVNWITNSASITYILLLFGFLFIGIAQWLVLRDSRNRCLSQLLKLVNQVEAAYQNRKSQL